MKSVAVIPLRKGSKGIPGKNKRKMLGRPLYQWVLTETIFSKIDKIVLFTDDLEIIQQVENEYFWTSKVMCIQRSKESAVDTASTELALLEVAEKLNFDFDIFSLLQVTSPLTTRDDINICLSKIESKQFDSVLTVVETKRFFWNKEGESLNYNYLDRPRRQDFTGEFVENGAIYAIKKETFLDTKNRLGGNICPVKMNEDTYVEIDEISDWSIMESLLFNRIFKKKFPNVKIKAIVFDVDGVFTDATVAVSKEGELFKQFSLRDGMGFELLKDEHITPIIMTSENSEIVKRRMEKLGLDNVYLGVKDKFSRLELVLQQLRIERNEVAYLGDDINDLSNIASCGWGLTPLDAEEEVKHIADVSLTRNGGHRVIRESIKFIIKQNNKHE